MHEVTWVDEGRTTKWMVPDGWLPLPPRAACTFDALGMLLLGRWAALVTQRGLSPVECRRTLRTAAAKRSSLHWSPRSDLRRRAVADLPPERTKPDEASGRASEVGAAQLQLTLPDGRVAPWPEGKTVLIGRHPCCHVRLTDRRVSALHCAIRPEGRVLRIVDLNSKNGTWYDDARLASATVARRGCLRVGRTRLFVLPRQTVELTPLPSQAMRRLFTLADRVAGADAPVLVQGESGSGKEGIARRLHERSGRRGRFVTLNAATLSPELAGSQLFGHVAGAFTGAERARDGAFVMAHEGTLFLDEVAELSIEVQAELLRVIEYGEVRPLGATEVVPVDVRLVTATHRDLAMQVRADLFREDLFHRIAVLPLSVPPLRERVDDIDAIADAYLEGREPPRRLTEAARQLLRAHPWPGNIRQLLNVLARACVLHDATTLGVETLDLPTTDLVRGALDDVIRDSVLRAYDTCGDVAATAKRLGLHRATVHRHIKSVRQR